MHADCVILCPISEAMKMEKSEQERKEEFKRQMNGLASKDALKGATDSVREAMAMAKQFKHELDPATRRAMAGNVRAMARMFQNLARELEPDP